MIQNPVFWLIFLSITFWSFYQKWDEKHDKYIQYPYITTLYFMFSSSILLFLFPPVLNFLRFDLIGLLFFIGVLASTFLLYTSLKNISDHKIHWPFDDYFQLLDNRYIIPKTAEILFQQIFFISAFILSLNAFGQEITIWVTVLAFGLAHLNLFLFRTKKEALFYLAFSFIGAPVFIIMIIATELLWYSISLHVLFYTFLSVFGWVWGWFKR